MQVGGKREVRGPPTAGITALVPPELIYACGWRALDVNNWIPDSDARPRTKLCAWTASWREAILRGQLRPDALVVVAGGDCHNALADGQRAARVVRRTHYFFYPFDGDVAFMKEQLEGLADFLRRGRGGPGGAACEGDSMPRSLIDDPSISAGAGPAILQIEEIKRLGLALDRARAEGEADPGQTFRTLISLSDMEGEPGRFLERLHAMAAGAGERGAGARAPAPGEGGTRRVGGRGQRAGGRGARPGHPDNARRVALIGVPPIYRDFHEACADAGLRVVFDELPHEFLRLGGRTLEEMARSYAAYTFARPVEYRLRLLKRELNRRRVDGVIHYTQFTCHHLLEDPLLREELEWPMLTVQGDLPGPTPAQARLRLEAFSELLGGRGRISSARVCGR